MRPAPTPVAPIPGIKDVIGKALDNISSYKELDNKKQVVALIDDVSIYKIIILSKRITLSQFLEIF